MEAKRISSLKRPGWLRRLMKRKGAVLGILGLLGLALISFGAHWISPINPIEVNPTQAFLAPGPGGVMGTDNFGRDVWTRFLYGGQISLQVGLVAMAIAGSVGTVLGVVAAFYGGAVDGVISWVVEVLQAFPGILLALAVIAVLGPGLINVMVAVGIGSTPSFMRMARGSVLAVREMGYVEASRALGASDGRIMFGHILPNILRPLVVLATLGMGGAILEGAALSFLGLGAQPPAPEWGAMLSAGRGFLRQGWWITVFPGVGVFLAILSINLIGDGLSDIL